jgi:GAF domain-containing protein
MITDGVRAAACLPFALQAKPIGVMWIHYREPRRFSEAEKETLRLYANQTAIAYDNARRMRELEHMRRAAEAMAGALEPAQVLQEIVESAREVSLADSSAIWSYDDVHNQFIPEELAASGIPRDKLERFRKRAPKKGGTADTVMALGWVGITDVHDARYGFMGPSTLELLDEIGVKSVQGIVLKAGDEKLGVLYANYNRPKSFTDADRRTLETFAHHASLALKKARLLKQVGKARNAAKVVAEVSTLGDLRHTLDSVVKGMQEALGSDAVILYTYDQEQHDFGLPPIMAGVLYRIEILELGWIAKQSVVRNILALGELHVAEDAPSDPLMRGPFVSREGILSSVGIPLQVEDRKVGVMFVNYCSPHRFTDDELTNIQLFANQAAVAIWNAQLYQAEQQRVKELAGLNSISQTIRSLTDIQQVYRQVNESVAQLAGAAMCAVLLYDDKRKELTCQLPMYGVPDEIGRQYRIPVAQGSPTGVIWDIRDYLILNDVERYSLVGELGLTHLAQEAGLRDTLLVKLAAGNRNIGVIQASNKIDGTAFSEDDARLLCIFAGQAAAVIENARLYEELKHSKGIIGARTALAWMGMASSAWRHTIDKHTMTIREQAHLLRQDWAHVPTSYQGTEVSRRIDTIERLATQILEKPITPPLSTEAGLESVSLSALISERARQLWQNDPYKPVRLRLDLQLHDSATARVSPEWLRRAFDMLVDNAVEAVSGREIQEITVGTRASRGGLEIFVSDTGPGIPEETRAKIGLEIIEKPEDAEGLGMGLLMAQTIVQTYGGEIRVESTGPMGTTMVIWLPSEE